VGEKSRGNWQIPFCLDDCKCRACQEARRRDRKREWSDRSKDIVGSE
jgi:hypothetical protein